MAIEKATILNLITGEVIPVAFNPEEYSVDAGNAFTEIAIPGLSKPPIQYGRGNAQTLKMELFYDTYEEWTDVRDQTRKITDLLAKAPGLQGPPILLFCWGGLNFRCVLESVSQKFTMFFPGGTPARARLTVSFKEYAEVVFEVQHGLFILPPTLQNVVEGDNLGQIAARTLGNPHAWRQIADLNHLDNPRKIEPGRVLVIPQPRALLPL